MFPAEIDLVSCIKCGICVELCPEVFAWSASGFVMVREAQEPLLCLEEAVRNCPADCIRRKEE